MRKVKLYIAQSLDGKIARLNSSIDWLEEFPLPKSDDYGYDSFCASVDTVIMGHNTYRQLLTFDIEYPYSKMSNFVFTRNNELTIDEHVHYINIHHAEFVKQLKKEDGKDIWLIGGAQINSLLAQQHLIDEIILFVIPVMIGDGIPLFDPAISLDKMKTTSLKQYDNGVVQFKFESIRI